MSRFAIAALLSLILLTAGGCAREPEIRFVDDAKSYTLADVERNVATISSAAVAKVSVADSAEVRKRALTRLRQRGAVAGEAADFMTSEFPVATRAVPYYVEAATVDGKRAWIIAEAWGGRTGTLGRRRLWVFARGTGEILGARTYR